MKIKIIILFIGGLVVLSLVGLGLIGYYAGEKEVSESDSWLKIQVSQNQNQGIEQDNAIIIVKTAENTKYLEREIPKFIPEGKSPADLIKQKEIAFADLKVGDDIIATAQENIAWQKEFLAQYVLRTKIEIIR